MNIIFLNLPNGLWSWFIFLLTGALIGYIAAIFVGSKRGGLIKFILIGIVGSYIGGILTAIFFRNNPSIWMTYLMAVVGSALLIIVLRMLKVIK